MMLGIIFNQNQSGTFQVVFKRYSNGPTEVYNNTYTDLASANAAITLLRGIGHWFENSVQTGPPDTVSQEVL